MARIKSAVAELGINKEGTIHSSAVPQFWGCFPPACPALRIGIGNGGHAHTHIYIYVCIHGTGQLAANLAKLLEETIQNLKHAFKHDA